jgi:hypothetical protein
MFYLLKRNEYPEVKREIRMSKGFVLIGDKTTHGGGHFCLINNGSKWKKCCPRG